eukprot:SAG31_NODE_2856_length_4992_cov_2.079910_1_plen_312_part_00
MHYLLYDNLMHASDWLPTLLLAAGGSTAGSLPLDGYNQWPSLQAVMAKANGKSSPDTEAPRKEIFYGSPDEQRVCYGSAQHTASGGGLCLDQNAIRVGKWKLIVGDGGMPNTWFAPVNASKEEHEAEQAQCVDADETYLHGFRNSESPFLVPTAHSGRTFAEKEKEVAWSCTNQTTWDEGQCRPGGQAISEASVANASTCCHMCTKHEDCVAWVYRSDRPEGANCWLKSSNSKTAKDPACTSAGIGCVKHNTFCCFALGFAQCTKLLKACTRAGLLAAAVAHRHHHSCTTWCRIPASIMTSHLRMRMSSLN